MLTSRVSKTKHGAMETCLSFVVMAAFECEDDLLETSASGHDTNPYVSQPFEAEARLSNI
jgi:hypothetical protein